MDSDAVSRRPRPWVEISYVGKQLPAVADDWFSQTVTGFDGGPAPLAFLAITV
jgi:hypothetical protein